MSNPTPITVNENKASSKYIDRNPPLASDPDLNRKVVDYLAYLKEILNFSVATTGKRITDTSGYVNELVRTSNSLISTIYDTQNGLVSKVEQNANSIALVVDSTTDTINAASIVAAINDAGSTVKISADHVDITGFVTFTDLSNDSSTTIINGANIRTGTISADRIGAGTITSSKLDSAVTQSISDAADAASAAQTTANGANGREQLIYISKASGTTSVSANTTWVTSSTDSQNAWRTKRPTYNSSYPVLFVATQRQTVAQMANSGTTCSCTTPVKDDTTTVIDGGHITTGTIDAASVTVTNINASNISTGTLSADRIAASSLSISKLSDLNVGSRNYWWAVSKSIHSDVTLTSCTCTYNEKQNGKYVVTSTASGNGQQTLFPANVIPVPADLVGKKMIFHADSITASGTNNPRIYLIIANSSGSQLEAPVLGPGALSTTFTVPANAASFRPLIRVRQSGTGTSGESVTVSGIKLEKGTVATDWSPAPEDFPNYSNLATSGETVINGGNISTGYIAAARIQAGTITADKIKANETFTQKLYAQDFNISGGSINIQTSADNDDRINLQRSRYGGQEVYSSNFAPERFQVLRTTTGDSRTCSSNMGPESITIARATTGQSYYDYTGIIKYSGVNFTSGSTQTNGIYMDGPLSATDGMGEIVWSDTNGRERLRIDTNGITFKNASGTVIGTYPSTGVSVNPTRINDSTTFTPSTSYVSKKSFTIPAGKYFCVSCKAWMNGGSGTYPTGIVLASSSTVGDWVTLAEDANGTNKYQKCVTYCGYVSSATTFYIWVKANNNSTTIGVSYDGFYL